LRHRVLSEARWKDRVEVVSGDMRDWNAPGKERDGCCVVFSVEIHRCFLLI